MSAKGLIQPSYTYPQTNPLLGFDLRVKNPCLSSPSTLPPHTCLLFPLTSGYDYTDQNVCESLVFGHRALRYNYARRLLDSPPICPLTRSCSLTFLVTHFPYTSPPTNNIESRWLTQANMIDEVREAVIQMLIRPLMDEEDEEATALGDRYDIARRKAQGTLQARWLVKVSFAESASPKSNDHYVKGSFGLQNIFDILEPTRQYRLFRRTLILHFGRQSEGPQVDYLGTIVMSIVKSKESTLRVHGSVSGERYHQSPKVQKGLRFTFQDRVVLDAGIGENERTGIVKPHEESHPLYAQFMRNRFLLMALSSYRLCGSRRISNTASNTSLVLGVQEALLPDGSEATSGAFWYSSCVVVAASEPSGKSAFYTMREEDAPQHAWASLGGIPNTMRRSLKEEWECTAVLPTAHTRYIYSATWSPEIGMVASTGSDSIIALYPLSTTEFIDWDNHSSGLHWTKDSFRDFLLIGEDPFKTPTILGFSPVDSI
ncbi:hypothetical protein K449DRAFT_468803 [Hypoxylon sp. EC38]|nr:hypothetical protein K449DRAFT_468803 [Hypoxylon sp. EC38]